MPANTTPDNIQYPVSTDNIAPLETVFASMANSVQTALNTRAIKSYRWANTAARNAQAGMAAGDVGYQIDDKTSWTYSGTAWVRGDSPGDPGIPFRVAAGTTATLPAGSFVTIDLPADRFTQPPIIITQINTGAGGDVGATLRVTSVTTTTFLLSSTVAAPAFWAATQMTSGSASG